MSNPIAVITSDVHYDLATLEVADQVMNQAISKANALNVPLIVAGDLHNSKANLRGECVSRMIKTFKLATIPPILLIGNHDKIHEKSEDHSLEFLRPYCTIIDKPTKGLLPGWTLIPYQYDLAVLKEYLAKLPPKRNLIMHQGVQGSLSGEYIIDRTAISRDDVAGHRVISGHYHTRQQILLDDGGLWSYIGNPYTLGFGEHKDPEKGFQILHDNSSMTFVPSNVRVHRVLETTVGTLVPWKDIGPGDPLWVKISGTNEELTNLDKETIGHRLEITEDFRLDLIPLDTKPDIVVNNDLPQSDILDQTIDNLVNTDYDRKERLKTLWKTLIS